MELVALVLVGRDPLGVGRKESQWDVASVVMRRDALRHLLGQWAVEVADQMPPQIAHEFNGHAMPLHQYKADIAERALQRG